MKIEERVKDAVALYESENSDRAKEFESAQSLFNDLIEKGVVEKRGNQLAEATQRTNIHVRFNCI